VSECEGDRVSANESLSVCVRARVCEIVCLSEGVCEFEWE
jgi:hypothetical protein